MRAAISWWRPLLFVVLGLAGLGIFLGRGILDRSAPAAVVPASGRVGSLHHLPIEVIAKPLVADAYVMRQAKLALDGRFVLQGVEGLAKDPDGEGYRWNYRGPRADREWAWLLNRHYAFNYLLAAYHLTGEDRFLRTIELMARDWIEKNPVPGRFSFSSGWRALEAARRVIDSWIPVLNGLAEDPGFAEEVRQEMMASLWQHGQYLRRNHHFAGNHLLTEMAALMMLAVVFREEPEATEWAQYAVRKIEAELERQILPDGVHTELSNHYQWIAGKAFQTIAVLLPHLPGGQGSLALAERLENYWDAFARVMRPNGTGPLNNDADLEWNAKLIRPLAAFYDRPDWLYMASGGREGKSPRGVAGHFFEYAGQLLMRSDWSEDSLWGYFEMGPHGTDHQQNDRLHLSLSLGQEDFLVDAGRYVYRDDEWSRWFRSARAHNGILINGREPRIPDRLFRRPQQDSVLVSNKWILGTGLNFYERNGWGRGAPEHRRTVVFHPKGGWLVFDEVVVFGPTDVELRWRYHPEVRIDEGEAGVRFLAKGKQRSLEQQLLAGPVLDWEVVAGREAPDIEGWYSPRYNQRMSNPVLVGSGLVDRPTLWVWWFRPDLYTGAAPEGEGRSWNWEPGDGGKLRLDLSGRGEGQRLGTGSFSIQQKSKPAGVLMVGAVSGSEVF